MPPRPHPSDKFGYDDPDEIEELGEDEGEAPVLDDIDDPKTEEEKEEEEERRRRDE